MENRPRGDDGGGGSGLIFICKFMLRIMVCSALPLIIQSLVQHIGRDVGPIGLLHLSVGHLEEDDALVLSALLDPLLNLCL